MPDRIRTSDLWIRSALVHPDGLKNCALARSRPTSHIAQTEFQIAQAVKCSMDGQKLGILRAVRSCRSVPASSQNSPLEKRAYIAPLAI